MTLSAVERLLARPTQKYASGELSAFIDSFSPLALSQILGVSAGAVRSWRSGAVRPTNATLCALCMIAHATKRPMPNAAFGRRLRELGVIR